MTHVLCSLLRVSCFSCLVLHRTCLLWPLRQAVLPQLLAALKAHPCAAVRLQLKQLLHGLGLVRPWSLVYPLLGEQRRRQERSLEEAQRMAPRSPAAGEVGPTPCPPFLWPPSDGSPGAGELCALLAELVSSPLPILCCLLHACLVSELGSTWVVLWV